MKNNELRLHTFSYRGSLVFFRFDPSIFFLTSLSSLHHLPLFVLTGHQQSSDFRCVSSSNDHQEKLEKRKFLDAWRGKSP